MERFTIVDLQELKDELAIKFVVGLGRVRESRLVLGDVGFGHFKETVSEEDDEKEKFERARSQ